MVPVLFWCEVNNVLRMAARRKRISDGDAEGSLFRCTGLPIETDSEMSPAVVLRIGRFAAEHQLTAYDAAYFELADRHSARLLTSDKGLLRLQDSHSWIQRAASLIVAPPRHASGLKRFREQFIFLDATHRGLHPRLACYSPLGSRDHIPKGDQHVSPARMAGDCCPSWSIAP
jgi:predicted nucleic acid-binding protein